MARQRTPEGPPPPPAVQRLRLRYAKRGRLRFSSSRDFSRALERALRRAGVPMAFSAGFHPHPLISYANAAPTGTASEAEYFEIRVTERVDPDALREALDEALPEGLDVIEVVEAGPGALADRLEASEWRLVLCGVERLEVEQAVAAFAVTGVDDDGCAILRMVVRHTTPSVRPDDILTALHAVTGLAPPIPPRVTRLAQGPLLDADDAVADPLATDKDAAGSGQVTREPREPVRGS
jgi:hypothetical protein